VSWRTMTVREGTMTETSLIPSRGFKMFSMSGTSEEQHSPNTSK